MPLFAQFALALLPVLFFLLGLMLLDAYRLVRMRMIYFALLAGCGAAVTAYVVNSAAIDTFGVSLSTYALVSSPLVEELIKAAYVIYLLYTRRIGFLADAAVLGFAVGAGFAIVENLYYLLILPDGPIFVWAIRGLGTAVMHGGATGLFAVVARLLLARYSPARWTAVMGGLVVAYIIHAIFNRLLWIPVLTTAVLLVILPLTMMVVYRLSEAQLQRWLSDGFDQDSEIFATIIGGGVIATPLGRYLQSLRSSFSGETLADMLCLLRLQSELSLRARGELLMRREGFPPVPDPELKAKLAELVYLEERIGKAGMVALRPVSRWSRGDDWERHRLTDS